MNGWIDEWWMDGWMNWLMDGWVDGWIWWGIWNFVFGCTVWLVGFKLPDQGLNAGPRQWKCWVLTSGPPGNSQYGGTDWWQLGGWVVEWIWVGWVGRQMRGQSENCQLANLYMKVKSYSWFSPLLPSIARHWVWHILSSVRSLLSALVSTPRGWFDWEHSERSWSTVL